MAGAFVPVLGDLEQAARDRLDAHVAQITACDRVCGLVIRPPILNAVVSRVIAADHDLVVMPSLWRELALVMTLRVKTRARVLLVSRGSEK